MDNFIVEVIGSTFQKVFRNEHALTKMIVMLGGCCGGLLAVSYIQDKELEATKKRVTLLETKLDRILEPVYEEVKGCD